eukprot:2912892-Rhodomonas_salina.2
MSAVLGARRTFETDLLWAATWYTNQALRADATPECVTGAYPGRGGCNGFRHFRRRIVNGDGALYLWVEQPEEED